MLMSHQVVAELLGGDRGFEVLHVGAHRAEEVGLYDDLGATRVSWVEAQPELCQYMRETLDPTRHRVYEGVAWSQSGLSMEFHLTSNSESSSVLPLGEGMDHYPEISEVGTFEVTTVRLDELVPPTPFRLINLDIQGAELHALQGMGALLDDCQVLYSEVSKKEIYVGLAPIAEMDAWLSQQGFARAVTLWWPGAGWGEAAYVRGVPRRAVWRARLALAAHLGRTAGKRGWHAVTRRTSLTG